MALNRPDTERLAKVLVLIDSDRDGEALAALYTARNILARAGMTLRDLVAAPVAEGRSTLGEPHANPPRARMELQQEVQILRGEVDALRAALQDRESEAASLRRFRDDTFQVLSGKNEEIMSLKRRIAALRDGGASAAADLERLRARRAEDAATIDDLRREHERLRDRLAGLTRDLEAARHAVAPRNNAEKRAAVLAYLRDPRRAGLSDREIARRAGVSPQTVSNWRGRLKLGGLFAKGPAA